MPLVSVSSPAGVAVTVTSDLAGDSEPLTLLETGPSTGGRPPRQLAFTADGIEGLFVLTPAHRPDETLVVQRDALGGDVELHREPLPLAVLGHQWALAGSFLVPAPGCGCSLACAGLPGSRVSSLLVYYVLRRWRFLFTSKHQNRIPCSARQPVMGAAKGSPRSTGAGTLGTGTVLP